MSFIRMSTEVKFHSPFATESSHQWDLVSIRFLTAHDGPDITPEVAFFPSFLHIVSFLLLLEAIIIWKPFFTVEGSSLSLRQLPLCLLLRTLPGGKFVYFPHQSIQPFVILFIKYNTLNQSVSFCSSYSLLYYFKVYRNLFFHLG